jgi:hypothetical protein
MPTKSRPEWTRRDGDYPLPNFQRAVELLQSVTDEPVLVQVRDAARRTLSTVYGRLAYARYIEDRNAELFAVSPDGYFSLYEQLFESGTYGSWDGHWGVTIKQGAAEVAIERDWHGPDRPDSGSAT